MAGRTAATVGGLSRELLASPKGQRPVNITMHIETPNPQAFRASQQQIANRLNRAVRMGDRTN